MKNWEMVALPPVPRTTRHRRMLSIDEITAKRLHKTVLRTHKSKSPCSFDLRDLDATFDLDSTFTPLLSRLSSLSSLAIELEVNHRILHSGLIKDKAHTSSSTRNPSVPLPSSLHLSIPYSKKLPASLYNASHNPNSLERSLVSPLLGQRIEAVTQKLEELLQSKGKGVLRERLMKCLEASIETESKGFVRIWDQVLSAFEEELWRKRQDLPELGSLESLFEGVSELTSETPLDWEVAQTRITKLMRVLLAQIPSKYVAAGVEQTWALSLAISHFFLTRSSPNPTLPSPPSPPRALPSLSSLQLQSAQTQITSLKATIDLLRKDADHYMTLIKDREAELKEIKSVSGTGDFDKLMEELNAYLEDAGDRQQANVETLESISRLLGYRFTGRNSVSVRPANQSIQGKDATLHKESEAGNSSSSSDGEREVNIGKIEETEKTVVSVGSQTEVRKRVCGFDTRSVEVRGRKRQEVPHNPAPAQIIAAASPATTPSAFPIQTPSLAARSPIIFHESTQTDLPDSLTSPSIPAPSPSFSYVPIPPLSSPHPRRPNPLLQALEKLAKRQPAMPLKPLFHLLESALDEKNRSDSQDLETNHPPRSMAEFMLDFMYMHYGLKSLTLKSLSAVVNALEGLSRTEQPYGVLFCRLLDVYTDNPIEDSLAAYLIKARSGFEGILLRYDKQYFKRDYANGGYAPLSEVADLLFDLFSPQREAGERVLGRLLPASWSPSEAALVLLCSKLARSNRDFRQFYLEIDTEKTGSVRYPSFEKGLQEGCGTLISKAQALALWKSLTKGSDTLGIQQVVKVQIKESAQKAIEVKVSKCSFLLEIVQEYEQEREQQRSRLEECFERFDPSRQGVLTLKDFTELISTLNPALSDDKAATIFREALDFCPQGPNLDALSAPAFCHIALKHRLGQSSLLAFFDCGLKDLTERLRDRFVRIEHELGDMAVATNKFRNPRPH